MSAKQSDAANGKRRGPYNLTAPRDYGGRGKIKCAICGRPITEHKTMALCNPKKHVTVVYLENEKQKRRRDT